MSDCVELEAESVRRRHADSVNLRGSRPAGAASKPKRSNYAKLNTAGSESDSDAGDSDSDAAYDSKVDGVPAAGERGDQELVRREAASAVQADADSEEEGEWAGSGGR